MTDQCLLCGQFVGLYPQGFRCDVHCRRCRCSRCETDVNGHLLNPPTMPAYDKNPIRRRVR